jgi:hypothetical protein
MRPMATNASCSISSSRVTPNIAARTSTMSWASQRLTLRRSASWRAQVEHDTEPGEPRGCLTVQGCLATGDEEQDIAALLAQRRAASQEALQRRLEQGVADRDLPGGTNCAALARYLCTVSQGISVQASGGVAREQLLEVATLALAAMPQTAGAAAGAQAVN